MNLFPSDIYEKLEFDKILDLLEHECFGEAGRIYFRELRPITDLKTIERQLKEAKELKLCLEKKDSFTMSVYANIEDDVKYLHIEGYVLSIESLQRINAILLNFKDLYRFFNGVRREIYPTLFEHIRHIVLDEDLSKEIMRVIDPDGNIKSDASPELIKIRKQTQGKMREIEGIYRRLLGEYRQRGMLTDGGETIRNGRRVLSVPVEFKRQIRGIIHDESSTGKTAFIEPEAAIDANNDLFDLEQEEKQEIYRILRDLSTKLRPYVPQILEYQSVIEKFDVIQAKARLGLKMKGVMPQIMNAPTFGIKRGRHPLLFIKNKLAAKDTVPFSLELFNDNRILLVSGPNAGGKSVLMKSIGLLQLMMQSGLLVPMHELSEMGIFESLFVQIGDSQSLEDDLSTYSSHLKNMHFFLENADNQSLILIDEFGSGTDPKMGGAIAEAILRGINERKAWGAITTHYGNLKMFAFRTEGIINACMNFDKDNLAPTYQLTVGRPGSSYAFEIATKVGLNRDVLRYAKKRIGENEQAVDELLIDLQREKQEYDEMLKELQEKQKMLDKLISQYDENVKDVEFRRKRLKLDAKELEMRQSTNEERELQRLVQELRQQKNLEEAQRLVHTRRKERVQLATEMDKISEDIYYQNAPSEKAIEVGTYVRMRTGSATGKVESIDKKEAHVLMGTLKVRVKIRELVAVNEPLEIRKQGINTEGVQKSANFDPKLDIRGMTMTDAMRVLQSFLDDALVSSATSLRIVHGKGDGVLRKLVRMTVKEYKEIKNAYHPEHFEGGDGVMIIEI